MPASSSNGKGGEGGGSVGIDIREEEIEHIPTKAQEVFDVSGAGDTVIAVFAMGIAGGIAPADSCCLANLAAGIVVAKLGTYAVSREELLKALEKEK